MNRTEPVTLTESSPLSEAIDILHQRGIHRLFVHDSQGRLVGVLSATDIIKMLYVDQESR